MKLSRILSYSYCLHNYGDLGKAAAIIFAMCGMWRLARFNVSTDIVHGYFMGLAIPAGGCIVASSTLLLSELNIQPATFGMVYPITIIIVGYLMVSHVHYPNFKGDGGEKIYLISKITGMVIFVTTILYNMSLGGILTAIFGTYAVFGIINSLANLFNKPL